MMTFKMNKPNEQIRKTFFRVPRAITVDLSDIPGKDLVLQEGDRLDILAEDLYGDPSLWRVLALYNQLGYFFDAVPGTVIRIPNDIQKLLERLA